MHRYSRKSLPPGGEGGAPAPDEGEIGERTHVTHPANTNRQASIPHPGALPCHLRANDFVIAAPPAKKHTHPPTIAAQSNPAPSGAPAGGISVAERYHVKQRTPQKAFPRVGKVARKRRMRAKSASVVHNAPHRRTRAEQASAATFRTPPPTHAYIIYQNVPNCKTFAS